MLVNLLFGSPCTIYHLLLFSHRSLLKVRAVSSLRCCCKWLSIVMKFLWGHFWQAGVSALRKYLGDLGNGMKLFPTVFWEKSLKSWCWSQIPKNWNPLSFYVAHLDLDKTPNTHWTLSAGKSGDVHDSHGSWESYPHW